MAHFGLEFKINTERFKEIVWLLAPSSKFKLVRQTSIDYSGNPIDNPNERDDILYEKADFYCASGPESYSIELFPATESIRRVRIYFDNYDPTELLCREPPVTYQGSIELFKAVLEKEGATDFLEIRLFPREGAEIIPFPPR